MLCPHAKWCLSSPLLTTQSNITCFCESNTFNSIFTRCLQGNCTSSEQSEGINFFGAFCQSVRESSCYFYTLLSLLPSSGRVISRRVGVLYSIEPECSGLIDCDMMDPVYRSKDEDTTSRHGLLAQGDAAHATRSFVLMIGADARGSSMTVVVINVCDDEKTCVQSVVGGTRTSELHIIYQASHIERFAAVPILRDQSTISSGGSGLFRMSSGQTGKFTKRTVIVA